MELLALLEAKILPDLILAIGEGAGTAIARAIRSFCEAHHAAAPAVAAAATVVANVTAAVAPVASDAPPTGA